MPIAGAPRTTISLIAAATSAAVRQATSTSSSGQPALVEEDDGVALEPDDPLRLEHAHRQLSIRFLRPTTRGTSTARR